MRLLLFFMGAAVLLAGCASEPPQYETFANHAPLTRKRAEAAMIEAPFPVSEFFPGCDATLKWTQTAMPEYPEALRKQRVEGTVRIRFTVLRDGTVGKMQVVGSAPEQLVAPATQALKRWRFRPMHCHGEIFPFIAEQAFSFTVEE